MVGLLDVTYKVRNICTILQTFSPHSNPSSQIFIVIPPILWASLVFQW